MTTKVRFKREHVRSKNAETTLTCSHCSKQIREGERYVYEAHGGDGDFWTERYHKACA